METYFDLSEDLNQSLSIYEILQELPCIEIETLTVKYNWENDDGFKD